MSNKVNASFYVPDTDWKVTISFDINEDYSLNYSVEMPDDRTNENMKYPMLLAETFMNAFVAQDPVDSTQTANDADNTNNVNN